LIRRRLLVAQAIDLRPGVHFQKGLASLVGARYKTAHG
jgi:hypothetical protein